MPAKKKREWIKIKGAKTHNLQNVDLMIPRDQLTVITGLSGSGKSSLAFDTLYAEGQRRYVESLSAYARQFLSMMKKPEVDLIEGLSPAIAIAQKTTSHNPRSTVGTVTEIYDYLRLLFARVGIAECPEHHYPLNARSVSQMVDETLALPEQTKVWLLAPVITGKKGENKKLFADLLRQGFLRCRVDGTIYELEQVPPLAAQQKHTIEVVIDRFKIVPNLAERLANSLATALTLSDGVAKLLWEDEAGIAQEKLFSAKLACPLCGFSIAALEPRLFSFNNPEGACPDCGGLGVRQEFTRENLILDEQLSLAEGAICGWNRSNPYYFALLTALAQHYHFSLDTPLKDLAPELQQIIFYGSGQEKLTFEYNFDGEQVYKRRMPFEGVINNFTRRYRETDSEIVKNNLARYLTVTPCATCGGSRLCREANHVLLANKNIAAITTMTISEAVQFFTKLKLQGMQQEIAQIIIKEIKERLQFLANLGLGYLTLARSADTLSGGEAQRIRLASQFGSGLLGVMYVLDEPTIGLHQRDNGRLLQALQKLRDLGNTVIVVEHDEEIIRAADYLVDMGPGAGKHGGEVVFQGEIKELLKDSSSLTSKYLTGKEEIPLPKARLPFDKQRMITINGATQNNLKKVTAQFPVGLFTCVAGISGSGKSSLVNEILYPAAAKRLHHATIAEGHYQTITGLEHLDKVIAIDQTALGRTPRSNPATYVGFFTEIRDLFAATPLARARGYTAGRFSFNVAGGRCEACHGDGLVKVEMHFLADIFVNCEVCHGERYNRETLEVTYKGKNIAEVLAMTVEEAREFFAAVPVLARKLQTLIDVGLPYVTLGQSATTFSGGEAQRVKLARELSRVDTGKTLYILDEPTTGLHFHDIKQLLKVLLELRDRGNTVIVIEHNLDVIKAADWVIDLGPEGGDQGGYIVAAGTPEMLCQNPQSCTGPFLKEKLRGF